MDKLKRGDRLHCIKDNVEFVYNSCCFNGMGSSAPGVMGDQEHPISAREADALGKMNRGISYWFKFHSMNKIYEVTEVFRDVSVHLTCNKSTDTTMTIEEIPNFFVKLWDI
jgi:hypothetical protein